MWQNPVAKAQDGDRVSVLAVATIKEKAASKSSQWGLSVGGVLECVRLKNFFLESWSNVKI